MATKHPGAVALGKLRWEGLSKEERQEIARKGGKARLKTLTKRQRKEIAKKAAAKRWEKKT
jgi:hypothetical protein